MRVDVVFRGQPRSFDDLDIGVLSTDEQIVRQVGDALGESIDNWKVDPPAGLRDETTEFVIVRPEAVHG